MLFFEVMKRLVLTLWGVLAFSMIGQLKATTIFSDNFNAENGGGGVLNYNSFADWLVGGGTVSLIGGPGFFDFFPQNGLYVNMDRASFLAGPLTSIGLRSPLAGVSFRFLAGSRRGNFNTVHMGVGGGLASSAYSLSSTPLTIETVSFTVLAPTAANLSFHNQGGSNLRLILGNVSLNRVSGVPDRSTIVFLAIRMFGLGLVGRNPRRLAYTPHRNDSSSISSSDKRFFVSVRVKIGLNSPPDGK